MTYNVVRLTQNAFTQGESILNGVVILHGKVYKLHRNKMNEVIFQFDVKKEYDNVKFLGTLRTENERIFRSVA
jgi:hypothetical protein